MVDLRCSHAIRSASTASGPGKAGFKGVNTEASTACLFRMHALLGQEVQSKVCDEATLVTPKNSALRGREKYLHNGLVGGSSPSSPTTHSRSNGDFPVLAE
jgi:hypothetical protein